MTPGEAFALQAAACRALGSPLTARVMDCAGRNLRRGGPVADRILAWEGDPSHHAASVPLRLAGALHAIVLSGHDARLAAIYAEPAAHDDAVLWQAIDRTLADNQALVMRWLDSPPQTNEVRRSAVIAAAMRWLAAHHRLPIVLSELGCSAGLNLLADRYGLVAQGRRYGPDEAATTLTPDWQGRAPEAATPIIAARRGVDLHPLNPLQDRLRILSYIWADQPDRLDRTRAALGLAVQHPGMVERGDAAPWLEARLAQRQDGALHLVCHTVAWQYFPPETRARCAAALDHAGRVATDRAPLACLGMETDPFGPAMALTLSLWPGGRVIKIGTADAHARWVRWNPPAP